MSSYDQNLLDEAPKATRAELQQGYSVDLLERPPRRTSSVCTTPPQTPQPVPLAVPLAQVAEGGSAEKFGAAAHAPPTPFWRTRNGITAIAIAVLIVVGAVVGGAVGGTVKESSPSGFVTASSSRTSTVTQDQGSQGIAAGSATKFIVPSTTAGGNNVG